MDNVGEFSSFTIENRTYNVKKLSVFEAISYHIEFMATLGGFLSSAIAILSKMNNEKNKNKKGELDELMALFGKLEPEKTEKLIKKVLSRVITPEQICLENPAAANDWFARPENAGDLWLVCLNGVVILLGEYLPSGLNTALLGLKKVLAGASMLKSNNASMLF